MEKKVKERKVKALSIEELKRVVGKEKKTVGGDCCTTTGRTVLKMDGTPVNPADVTPKPKRP